MTKKNAKKIRLPMFSGFFVFTIWGEFLFQKQITLYTLSDIATILSLSTQSQTLSWYSYDKITTTWIQISCQNWNGFSSNISCQRMMLLFTISFVVGNSCTYHRLFISASVLFYISEKCWGFSDYLLVVNVWRKRFKLPQLTHESFLAIDHSCKIFFWYLPNWTSTDLW